MSNNQQATVSRGCERKSWRLCDKHSTGNSTKVLGSNLRYQAIYEVLQASITEQPNVRIGLLQASESGSHEHTSIGHPLSSDKSWGMPKTLKISCPIIGNDGGDAGHFLLVQSAVCDRHSGFWSFGECNGNFGSFESFGAWFGGFAGTCTWLV